MTHQAIKLTLTTSLILFLGFADLAFGQRRSQPQRSQPQQRTTQQEARPQQGTQRQGTQTRQPVVPAGPQQRVLIIAAGRLPDAPHFGGLNGADFDADALAHAFANAGIPQENIIFRNKNGWTRDAVQERLNEMTASSRPGDSLVVVLIGKTVQKGGLHYFCAADTTDSAITERNDSTGLIRISTLVEQQIAGAAATHRALILDLVGNEGFPDFSNLEPEGLWLLTSAAAGEESLREQGLVPDSREVRGVFNYYLTQGLLGMADFIGNNDGVVSFNELSNYATQNTRSHAERADTRQTPQMLGTMVQQVGTTVFNIGHKREGILAVNRHVFDESHLAKSLSNYLALVGNAIVMSAQADLRKAFADADERTIQSMGKENAATVDVTDYLKRQGDANTFAIANFLNPALNDPENKLARLAIATAARAWGDYDDALPNYNDAGELFELYVVDRLGDEAENPRSPFGNDLTLDRVPLRSEPSGNQTTGYVNRGTKVFAQEFVKGRSGHPNDDWIKVRAYPFMEPDYVEGWIHRDYLYWSPEAAEWYTPEDGLMKLYTANVERFERRAIALERDARAREIRARRIATIGAIAGNIVGGDVGAYIQGGSYAAAGVALARAQAQRMRAAGSWQQFLHWQQVGEEHRAQLRTVGDQTRYYEAARIIIDPNDLPF